MRYKSHDALGIIEFSQVSLSSGDIEDQRFDTGYAFTGSLTRSDITRTVRDHTGWRPPTPYVVNDTLVEFEFGRRELTYVNRNPGVENGSYVHRWEGPCAWTPSFQAPEWVIPSLDAEAYGRCVTKALLKLRDQKINLALNAVEMSKTAEGVAKSATKIYKSLRAFKNGEFVRALSVLGLTTKNKGKDAASSWLEMQYGILPLMGDIHGAYEEVTRKPRNHGMRKKVTAQEELSRSTSESGIPSGIDGFSGDLKFNATASGKLVLWFEVDNPALLAASSVGLTNPLEIVWEITPFSFIVDWFLPIGDYLGALTASQGFKYLGGCWTTKTTQMNQRWLTPLAAFVSGTDPWVTVYPSCSGRRITVAKSIDRIPVLVLPEPPLPSLEDSPLSVKRALNALALLRTLR